MNTEAMHEKQKKRFIEKLRELSGVSEQYADAAFYTMGDYAVDFPRLAAISYTNQRLHEEIINHENDR